MSEHRSNTAIPLSGYGIPVPEVSLGERLEPYIPWADRIGKAMLAGLTALSLPFINDNWGNPAGVSERVEHPIHSVSQRAGTFLCGLIDRVDPGFCESLTQQGPTDWSPYRGHNGDTPHVPLGPVS